MDLMWQELNVSEASSLMKPENMNNNNSSINNDDNNSDNAAMTQHSRDDSRFAINESIQVSKQSNQFIVENDITLTIFYLEYGSMIIILLCIVCCLFSLSDSDIGKQFALFSESKDLSADTALYIILSAVTGCIDRWLFTYAMFKASYATLIGIIDVSDILITYILSFVWLSQTPTVYGAIGAVLIISGIAIGVYPWQNHKIFPKSF